MKLKNIIIFTSGAAIGGYLTARFIGNNKKEEVRIVEVEVIKKRRLSSDIEDAEFEEIKKGE